MYSFKDFLLFLWARKKAIQLLTLVYLIILCSLFFFLNGFQHSNQVVFLTPVTESSQKERLDAEDEQEKEEAIINGNLKLIKTYKELVKSDLLVQKIQKSNPQFSKQDILDSLEVTSQLNSQIFTVMITTNDLASSTKIAEVLSKDLPQVAERAELPKKIFLLSTDFFQTKRSPSLTKLIIVCLFIAFMFSTSSVFLWFYFYERKFVQVSEWSDSMMGLEVIGKIDFYK